MKGVFNMTLKDNLGERVDRPLLKRENWYRIVKLISDHPVEIATALHDGYRIEIEEVR
jgi:hypothetical protein